MTAARWALIPIFSIFCTASSAQAGALAQLRGLSPASFEAPAITLSGPAAFVETRANVLAPSRDPRVKLMGPVSLMSEADARLDLPAIRDRHWPASDAFPTADGKAYVSIHFDSRGKAYFAVKAPGWSAPSCLLFAWGAEGSWTIGGQRYHMAFDATIIRSTEKSLIEISNEDTGTVVFSETLHELQDRSYDSGQPIRVGAHAYRLFYGDAVDPSSNPAKTNPALKGIVIVEKGVSGGVGGYKAYVITLSDVPKDYAAGFLLDNGQGLGARLSQDGDKLELFDIPR